MLSTETVTTESGLRGVEAEWRELWADGAQPSLFLSFDWVIMCWRRVVLRRPEAPRLVLVREDGRLVLAAAMERRRSFGIFNEMSALTTSLPQHDDVLMRRDGSHETWVRAFRAEAMKHPLTLRLCFDRLLADGPFAAIAHDLGASRSAYGLATLASMPTGFDDYFATRTKLARSDHRRQLRRLAEIGETAFCLSDASTIDDDLDWLLERKRLWQPRMGELRAWFRSQSAENDLRLFCHEALSNGELLLGVLRVGGDRIGATLCFTTPKEAVCYVLAYDDAFERQSPGRTALILCFEAAAHRGATRLDFMGGSAEWKARLGTEQVVIERLRLRRRLQ